MTALLPAEERQARQPRSEAWRRDFIARHGGRCHYCNRVGSLDMGPGGRPWHIDHKTALAVGGTDDEDNLVLACKRCNLAKNTKPYKLFKALAEAAYWTPDEGGPSEAELDHLAELYERTDGIELCTGRLIEPREWRTAEREDNATVAFWRYADDEETVVAEYDDWSPLYRTERTPTSSEPAGSVARFLVAAHRLVPALIAEVHLLRHRLAELEDRAA